MYRIIRRVSLVTIALAGFIVGMVLHTASAVPALPPGYGSEPCNTLAQNLIDATYPVDFDTTDFLMHSIGCTQDEGGVYVHQAEPKFGGGCNDLAYALATIRLSQGEQLTGEVIHAISVQVVAVGCHYTEGGGYDLPELRE